MKKPILILLATTAFISCKKEENKTEEIDMSVTYPQTKKVDTTNVYFGETIADPYFWLEDDRSAETEAWVKAENEVTFGYLDKIPFRKQIKERLEKLWNYEKVSAPFKEGNYTYFYKNDGLQNQSVLYRKDESGKEEVFLDPNTFSKDGTTSLGGLSFTKDGSMAAYAISEGGSDWRKVIVLNTETKEQIGDTIVDVKFSGMSWYKNDGFYYSSYDKPKGSELSAKTDQHKLYYHKLGTSQKEDKVIFGLNEKRRYVGGYVTEDENYLIISAANATNGNELYVKDLANNGKIQNIVNNFDSNNDVLDNIGTKFYVVTDYEAPNKRIVTFDLTNPTQTNWVDFIAETENVLSPSSGGGFIFAKYMKDAISQVKQYNYEGKLIREVEFPELVLPEDLAVKKKKQLCIIPLPIM